MGEIQFEAFPSISRLNREVIVTEKLDGTNAQVLVVEDGDPHPDCDPIAEVGPFCIWAGSRTRFIRPGKDDNSGFAAWVVQNAEALTLLGPGQHFGEWWGQGIQRRYGLTEKRFSLFNVGRWADDATRPTCCHVVPELWRGPLLEMNASTIVIVERLRTLGSVAAPGFMNPEGIVVFHTASRALFKYTLDKNDGHKGAA